MSLTLKAPKGCHLSSKILIAAAYSKAEVKVETIERDPKKGYVVDSPMKKTPVLVTPEGTLFESYAIARFVARQNEDPAHLYGNNAIEAGQVESWVSFAAGEVEIPLTSWVWSSQGKINVPGVEKTASGAIRKVLAALDAHLKDKTYLVGQRVSLADVVVAAALVDGFTSVVDAKVQKPFKNVVRWFKTILNQPEVISVLGEVTIAGEKAPCNAGGAAAPAPAAAAAAEEEDDDDFDCFGDEDEDDIARENAREDEIQKIADERAAAKEEAGKGVIAKSVVVLDVKPWDSETDLSELEVKIRGIEMEGLEWKSSEKKPVAFGVFKLCIMCYIVDKLVSVDDLQEKIEAFSDEVQSTDIATFTKL